MPPRLYTLVVTATGCAATAYFLRRPAAARFEDGERERRAWLDRIGRVTDGTVIDVQEGEHEGRPAVLLVFEYDAGGVTYHASQDVTYLRQWINLTSCRMALHTSVKYDPRAPGNSIVISERWIGLRQHPPRPLREAPPPPSAASG